jgi:hypothetical protein
MSPDVVAWLGGGVSATFVALALWHFYMAVGGLSSGAGGAVPSVAGKPVFVPSTGSTAAVGTVLLMFAALVAATAGLIPQPLPTRWLAGLSYALAAGLLARTVGDFKYVGLFKRVRGTPFARLDTLLYSPLCLVLSLGVASVALGSDE